MPINENTFKNLSNNQIWFSSPLKFNDPFDFFVPYSLNFTDNEFRNIIPKYPNISDDYYEQMLLFYKKNPKVLEEWIEKGRKRFTSKTKIACFCEEKSNIIMWSHYADSHEGLCLKFDSSYDNCFFHEDNWDYHKMPIKKVIYPKEIKKINYFKDNNNFFINCAYTKFHQWYYEKEHRIISTVDAIQYNKDCLVEVNFGCKLKPTDDVVTNIIERIKSYNYPKVKFIQAIKRKNRFGLKFEEIK